MRTKSEIPLSVVVHTIAGDNCSLAFAPKAGADYLNLREVQVFWNGTQLPRSMLTFVQSSTFSFNSASLCNDGNLTTVCHTGVNGSLTISFKCEQGGTVAMLMPKPASTRLGLPDCTSFGNFELPVTE